jgi:quercetin dioxygenase-like cupin family protein
MIINKEPIHSFDYDAGAIGVWHVNKGEGLPKHTHLFAHATVCCAGSCIVRKEGREVIITPTSQPISLVANEWHEIEALEDGTVFFNAWAGGKYI